MGFNVASNSQGHISDETETLIPPLPAALFEEYEVIFYMHCPIDRAAHTQPLINQSWALVGMESGAAAAGKRTHNLVCSGAASIPTAPRLTPRLPLE